MIMDIAAYSKAFDKFIVEMERFTEPYSLELQSVLEEVCGLLNIGRLELFVYDSLMKEEAKKGERLVYFFKSPAEKEAAYEGRHVAGNGSVLVFKYHKKVDVAEWDEEELAKIKALDVALYTFSAKIRLANYAENAVFYDSNLHIPNMSYFHREVSRLIVTQQILDYGICFFNIKRFSMINQLLGRELGSKVMGKFVMDLQNQLKDDGCICRMGGDNFVIFFKKEMADIIVTYLSGVEVVYDEISDGNVIVRASAGIYMCSNTSLGVDDYIEKAQIAMIKARNRVDNNIMFYDDEMQQMHEHTSLIESVFKEAISREEFLVYYQPKVQLGDYTIAGAEALCRWFHNGSIVRPDDFVPILENSNAICTLDFYMLEHVCRDIRHWLDDGLNVVRISVNLSRRHLGDEKLLDRILGIIDKYDVPHEYIEIELTETTTDVAFADLKKIVNGLHDHGIHTSVDDFGVGYSSLNLIRQVAWDVIKIDKSFLPSVSDRTSSQYLMFSHLLEMFRELGLKCIVEGVETIEQVKMLKDNRCFLAQGFFFDKPLEVKEFMTRLR